MYDADDVAGRVGNLNIPYVQFAAFLHQMGHGCDGVALGNGLHMTATDADAHAYLPRAERRRANSGNILCQSQRSTATQEAKRLTVALIHLHGGHAQIIVGSGDEIHAERR